ncbi:MAG TPA: SRPBCC family protein [Opitutaceae bacterium]
MLATILIVLAVLVVGFLAFAASRPADFRITRDTTISAAPAVIFPHVNDLGKWKAWSPWENLDPTMKRTFEGLSSGVGAVYAWEGNKQVGSGRMTITECRPHESIRIKLEFFKPMSAVNVTGFAFKPEGNRTTVTWSMSGRNNFIAKAFSLFMNMDKMVGGRFEQGLNSLKAVSESSPGR